MSGPNLTLADLRWLVSRCEDLPGQCPITVTDRDPDHGVPARYESITVHAMSGSRRA